MLECLCYARDAHQLEPIRYQWSGNVLWAIYPACPTHGEHLASPVWHPRLGQLIYKADAVEAPAAVEV